MTYFYTRCMEHLIRKRIEDYGTEENYFDELSFFNKAIFYQAIYNNLEASPLLIHIKGHVLAATYEGQLALKLC